MFRVRVGVMIKVSVGVRLGFTFKFGLRTENSSLAVLSSVRI